MVNQYHNVNVLWKNGRQSDEYLRIRGAAGCRCECHPYRDDWTSALSAAARRRGPHISIKQRNTLNEGA